MEAIHTYMLILKVGFFLILIAVVAFLTWRDRKAAQNSWKPVTNLRSFPKSEAERIAEFRQKYVPRVARH